MCIRDSMIQYDMIRTMLRLLPMYVLLLQHYCKITINLKTLFRGFLNRVLIRTSSCSYILRCWLCCFSMGRILLSCSVLTLTGLTLIRVSVVISHAIKREETRHEKVKTSLNVAMPIYQGVYGHFRYDGGLALQRRRNKGR